MVSYIARQYLLLMAAWACPIILLMLGVKKPLGESLFQALVWASLLSSAGTYFDFRRRNLCPLFDNLRIRIAFVLGALVTGTLSCAALLHLWI